MDCESYGSSRSPLRLTLDGLSIHWSQHPDCPQTHSSQPGIGEHTAVAAVYDVQPECATSHVFIVSTTRNTICTWVSVQFCLVYTEALNRPWGSLVLLARPPSLPPCHTLSVLLLALPIPSSKFFSTIYLLHTLTSQLSSVSIRRRALCHCLNDEMWDIAGCGANPRFNTKSVKPNTRSY